MAEIIDKKTIEKMAKLSHIKLEDGANFSADLSAILDWMAQLDEVDVSGVEPLASPLALKQDSVMREDKAAEPIDQETALGSAPESQSGFFTTPKTNE